MVQWCGYNEAAGALERYIMQKNLSILYLTGSERGIKILGMSTCDQA